MSGQERRHLPLLTMLFVLGGLGVLLLLGPPLLRIAIQATREAARRRQVENNLHQIEQALQNYHNQHPDWSLQLQPEIDPPDEGAAAPLSGQSPQQKAVGEMDFRLAPQEEESGSELAAPP